MTLHVAAAAAAAERFRCRRRRRRRRRGGERAARGDGARAAGARARLIAERTIWRELHRLQRRIVSANAAV